MPTPTPWDMSDLDMQFGNEGVLTLDRFDLAG